MENPSKTLNKEEINRAKRKKVRKTLFWIAVRHTAMAMVLPGLGNALMAKYDIVDVYNANMSGFERS
ncbi:hypothetical protein FLONG3_8676 [Fusarium longipes]|uniref:Uncharacterized protein n=1 Tax=Fusarium longipes TaxID=694270 RepID=A0A395S3R9_9HYPO|nr:hypothetical protein FLONG3_8676 [Fusarium longipes]